MQNRARPSFIPIRKTVSLFIAGLAFPHGPVLMAAKEGILIASTVAGLAGWLLLRHIQNTKKD